MLVDEKNRADHAEGRKLVSIQGRECAAFAATRYYELLATTIVTPIIYPYPAKGGKLIRPEKWAICGIREL